ncbi:MAG: DUF3830 family protein [Anaerovoracaceae bacterium]|jgi:hypothetical protein|nr:DUF3830 family protein [Anaerovoracaceae bacterium]
MTKLKFKVAGREMIAVLEEENAPKTCEVFKKMLPLKEKMIHVRWSGQGVWIPYGEERTGLEYENNTSHPQKGQMLLYIGGVSEMEIILAYGACLFASASGQLSGNHFLTIVEGEEYLEEIGTKVLWEGAQEVEIDYL